MLSTAFVFLNASKEQIHAFFSALVGIFHRETLLESATGLQQRDPIGPVLFLLVSTRLPTNEFNNGTWMTQPNYQLLGAPPTLAAAIPVLHRKHKKV